jgi:large subunit ribosomal protein L7/L12
MEETKKMQKPDKRSEETKPNSPRKTQFSQIIGQIEKLSVKDLAGLVKELEDKWGLSAASVAVQATPKVGEAKAEEKEEKTEYTVHLADSGSQKIAVIKAVREIRNDLGLKEAKDLVDGAPKDIKKRVSKDEAEEAKKKLEAAGAKVELR